MFRRIASFVFAVLLVAGVTVSGFAQNMSDLEDLQRGVEGFSTDLAKSLPLNSSLGLNWSDAYIGQFSHWGAGLSVGVTTMQMTSIKELAENFDVEIPFDMARFPIPAYALEGRIGGFGLPFDIGLKFGILPGLKISEISLDYLMVGADFRYAIMDEKATSPLSWSAGLGLNYLKGGIGASADIAQSFSIQNYNISVGNADVNFEWNTFSVDLKTQISKTFAFLTPYLGAGGSFAFSNAGYSVDAPVRINGRDVAQADIDEINRLLTSFGLKKVDITADGISSIIKDNAIGLRVFGGFSLNISAFRIDITGLYSILDNNFGGSLGLRVQM